MNTPRENYRLLFDQCILCRSKPPEAQSGFCSACTDDLPRIRQHCPRCYLQQDQPNLCRRCFNAEHRFDRAYALFDYRFPVDQLIAGAKYHDRPAHIAALAQLFCSQLPAERLNANANRLIIPMPMHPTRLRERGFNQSEILAKVIQHYSGYPLSTKLLRKIRHTPGQMTLKRNERLSNLRNSFSCEPLPCRDIILVDDVVTTGTSASEASRVLRRAGAEKIEVWSLVRTASD